MTTTVSQNAPRQSRIAPTVGIATLVAIAAALVVYVLARLISADLVVAPPGQPSGTVNALSVIVIILVSGLGALVVALVLRRVAPTRARIVFLVLALLVFVVSMFGPLGASDRTSTAVWLSIMHIVVAAVIITATLRALPAPASRQAARR